MPKSKTHDDGPVETVPPGDPPEAVSEGVTWGKFLESLRELISEMARGVQNVPMRGWSHTAFFREV